MKTREMFATLQAFAKLAEADRAEELRRFSAIFNAGKEEAVAARIKRILARWKANPVEQGYPAPLQRSLAAIGSGLAASGAKKQASDLEALLSLFEGRATASVESFVGRIMAALAPPPVATSPRENEKQSLDQSLANQLADELARTVLHLDAFSKVASRLHDTKLVSTPTLGAIANRFLGNSKSYEGRKPAIDDIMKRQKQDARSHARGKALDRIGV